MSTNRHPTAEKRPLRTAALFSDWTLVGSPNGRACIHIPGRLKLRVHGHYTKKAAHAAQVQRIFQQRQLDHSLSSASGENTIERLQADDGFACGVKSISR